jgi:protein O-mannosyl-transferase
VPILHELKGRRTVLALVVAAVAVLAYLNSLPAEFVLDDFPAVISNPGALWPLDWDRILFTNYWGNPEHYKSLTIYRPLATLSFALSDAVGARDCAACHRLINIVLHAGCSTLVFFLAWFLTVPTALPRGAGGEGPPIWIQPVAATSAGLLFALHPVHTEAVVGIVNRAELLAAFFILLGALAILRLRRWRMILIPAIYALALLSKENGATLWSVAIAYHLAAYASARLGGSMRLHRKDLLLHVGFAVVLGLYLLLRSHAVVGLLAGELSAADNPMVGAGSLARLFTPFKVFGEYFRLQVAPSGLTIDYSLNHLPAATSLLDFTAWVGVAAAAAMLVLLVVSCRAHFSLAFSLLAFFGTYVVVSNTLFLSTIIMAERLIYLPSAFFLLALVLVAVQVSVSGGTSIRRFLGIGAMVVTILFGTGTFLRNRDWLTPHSLYSAAVASAPQSAKSRHLLGNELAKQGQLESAAEHLLAGAAIDPTNFVLRTNTARTLGKLGRYAEALPHLKAALAAHPGYRPAFELVCAIFERTGQPPSAGRHCFPRRRAPEQGAHVPY